MQVTIEAISRKDKEIQGRMKQVTAIKTTEYGEKWLSTFSATECSDWQKGDVVDVEITQKGEFLNFRPLPLRVKVAQLETNLNKVMQFLNNKFPNEAPQDQAEKIVELLEEVIDYNEIQRPVQIAAGQAPKAKAKVPENKFNNEPLPDAVSLDDLPF